MPTGTLAAPQVQEKPAQVNDRAPASVVPFVRASDQNLQTGGLDRTVTLGAFQDLGVNDVTAYGYIRYLYLHVQCTTAGNAAATTFAEDGPFNVLQNIALTEPNGAYIVQLTSGYEAYLINKYGGYNPQYSSDPKNNPVYSATTGSGATGGSFTFVLRIPVELSGRDAAGSLANQDAAGPFKLRLSLNANASVYGVAPTAAGSCRVRAYLSAWDQPEQSSAGLANQTEPPGSGTTSFWSVQSGITVNAGENTIELKRRGNYLRQIIFILRRAGTTRSTGESDWPDETRFLRDAFPARYYAEDIWKTIMYERTGYRGTADAAGAPENGVRFHDYMNEFNGSLGYENRDLWQPTRGSTRLEIAGNFGTAGTLTVITNDVAVAQDVFL